MAWFFDETDDNVEVTDASPLTIPNADWTFGFQFWIDDNTGTQSQYMVSWGGYDANPSFNILLYEVSHANADRLEARIRWASGSALALSPGAGDGDFYQTGVWHRLLIRRSGTTLALFSDGTSVASGTIGGGVNLAANLWIGSRSDENVDRFFGGRMAEMFKIDRALSNAEIAGLSNGASPSRLSGIHDSTSWYLPMYRDRYVEWKNRLTLANTGSVGVAHPPVQMPFGRHQAVHIAPEAAPPGDSDIQIAMYHRLRQMGV